MPNITAPALSIPSKALPGTQAVASGVLGELVYSQVMAKYATLVKTGKVQTAYATVTAPVIYSTAAGTGGPIIWSKPGSGIDGHILAVGLSVSVASAVAGAIGLTGNVGQTSLSAGTAIDASGNAYVGGPASAMGLVARVATPTNPGNFFLPLFNVGTAATSAQFITTFIDVGGAVVCSPGGWVSIAGSASLTTLQVAVCMIWAELPA